MESQVLTDALANLSTNATAIGDAIGPVSARIDDLAGQVAAGLSPDEQATVATNLQTIASALGTVADTLKALGNPPATPGV